MTKAAKYKKAAEYFREKLKHCDICPHNCGADRTAGETGFCRTAGKPVISSHGLHYGEERELVGRHGSGTIFFTSCNLACKFCQNYDISQLDDGEGTSTKTIAGIMLSLQKRSCHNINLVTPTHQVPMILEALARAADKGLDLPVVYNCGGYEKVETIRELDGVIDIYMPDFKWSLNELGEKYSGVPDYADRAREALLEMHKQVGVLEVGTDGVAKKGLLIRHLVMPGMPENSKAVLDFIADELSTDSYVNIMDQYHPAHRAREMPELMRLLTYGEYEAITEYAKKLGLHRGFPAF